MRNCIVSQPYQDRQYIEKKRLLVAGRVAASLAIGDARCVSVIGGIGESGERRYGQLGAER